MINLLGMDNWNRHGLESILSMTEPAINVIMVVTFRHCYNIVEESQLFRKSFKRTYVLL